MRKVERSIHVGRPPKAVYDVVSDPTHYPDFFVGLEGWDVVEGTGRDVGDRLRVLLEIGATHSGGIVRVSAAHPPGTFAWASEVGTRHQASFGVRADGDGSRVRFSISFRLAGGMTGRVVERIATPIVVRIVEATLESLRHRVEWGEVDQRAAGAQRPAKKEIR